MTASQSFSLRETPEFTAALGACIQSLRQIASYELDASLQGRLLDLGERKELLPAAEHEELLALVSFAEKRTIERLQAQLALKRLSQFVPELVDAA